MTAQCDMRVRRFVILTLVVLVIMVIARIDLANAIRCQRVPVGSGLKKSQSTGNFRIRLSDNSEVYTPGKQYTVYLERSSNRILSRDRPRPTFTGFFLAVEQKSNTSTEYAEEFSSVKHGTFKAGKDESLVKLLCGNVVTHTSETTKSGIEVDWTAPESGSGCVTFRATIIEHRDVWYMDDGYLTKDFCEDEEMRGDVSDPLDECGACNEAKYELTFEGLWSRNTHPKGFPGNVHITKFGDIIGATHKNGNGFWKSGDLASVGLREVAEVGTTRTLESELKDKSDSIRTIIKARGLSHPNVTGKTFAVFRVDSEHHLVSLVSMISPSPDWFVGVAALELCQSDGTWLERKVVDLYPWDAGTDKGISYESPDQPTKPAEFIRRITSDSPNNEESPFFDKNGSKMKPLARLTLLRQRLYEKNCTGVPAASDECAVGEYGAWSECTGAVCGGTGKSVRQRSYKYPEKATKCHRKLFDTKTCTMPRCSYEYEDNDSNDSQCTDSFEWSEWSPCSPECKNQDNETGKQTRRPRYRKPLQKMCAGRRKVEPQERSCQIEFCNQAPNQNENETPEQTEESIVEIETTEPPVNCTNQYQSWKKIGDCEGDCEEGLQTERRISINPQCEPEEKRVKCILLKQCKNEERCDEVVDKNKCEKSEEIGNYIFYNKDTCSCDVFTTNCSQQNSTNMFVSFNECQKACPVKRICENRARNDRG